MNNYIIDEEDSDPVEDLSSAELPANGAKKKAMGLNASDQQVNISHLINDL